MKREIVAEGVDSVPGVLSQAVEANGMVFVSGQIPITGSGEMVKGSVEQKVNQIMHNIRAILGAAGSGLDDVVKVTIYVTDLAQMPEINQIYPKFFADVLPAREAVCVKALPLGATIEISVIAVKA